MIEHRSGDELYPLLLASIDSFPTALPAHSGPRPLIQLRNHFSQTVGPLWREISPSQGRYLNTWQHKNRINAYTHQTSMPWVGSQRPRERRQFMPQTARLLLPAASQIWGINTNTFQHRKISIPASCNAGLLKTYTIIIYMVKKKKVAGHSGRAV
jgi:hypothetical protein